MCANREPLLKTVKTVVEIVAILLAGGWALMEFGLKEREARLGGQQMRRATLSLTSESAAHDGRDTWVLSHLRIKNSAKRTVRTFLISWWWYRPPLDGEDGLQTSRIHNDPTVYDLAPGEESEANYFVRIPRGVDVAVIHAEVLLEGWEDGNVCRVSPDTTVPKGGVGEMTNQPLVCAARTKDGPCIRPGCPSQAAETIVEPRTARSTEGIR